MDKKTVVAAIVASDRNCFTEADVSVLEQFSDERLTALAEAAAAPEPKPATPDPTPDPTPAATPDPDPQAAQPEELTEEQWLAQAPASLRDIIDGHNAAQAARRTELVTQLKAAQSAYTPEELQAMPVAQLEKIATIAKPKVDYSPLAPRHAGQDDEGVAAPPSLVDSIKAARSH